MSPERRKAAARQLQKNRLLPVLFEERRAEIREAWETEVEPHRRETLWHELQALNNFRDTLDARISTDAAD